MSSDTLNSTTFPLNTGVKIPALALGTYLCPKEDAYNSVLAALKDGYRHIDTASAYLNEDAVGKAIRDSGVPRKEIFLTTKLWAEDYYDPIGAFEVSIKKLGLDYVDLYLMHWPIALKSSGDKSLPIPEKSFTLDETVNFVEVYEKLQELPPSKVKAIGVSNFDIYNLKVLLDSPTTKIVPATNQVELHVRLPQQKLVDFCHSKKIVPEAWGPLGQGDMDYDVLKKIAKKHNVTPANVVLNWNVQRGVAVLPKSVHDERISANAAAVKLDDQDMKDIMSISQDLGIKRHGGPEDTFKVNADVFHGNADSE